MIAYFDTSAFVPLLLDEPGTAACSRIWRNASKVVTTRLLLVETSAALARVHRMARLGPSDFARSRALLDQLWPRFNVVELDESLMTEAADAAGSLGLRGFDAVHCAAARRLDSVDLVAASGDTALIAAWRKLGLATALV